MNQLERSVPNLEDDVLIETPKETEDNSVSNEDLKELVDSTIRVYEHLKEVTEQEEPKVLIPLANPPKLVRNKFYLVIYTPGRKPRKRDIKDHKLMITNCSSEQEALADAKARVLEMGLKWKEKHCSLVLMKPEDMMNEIINHHDDMEIKHSIKIGGITQYDYKYIFT